MNTSPRLTWSANRMLRAMLKLWDYQSVKPVYEMAKKISVEQKIPLNSAVLNTALRLHARKQCHA